MVLTTFPGLPTTMEYGGISLTTTEPAPIIVSCPIVMLPIIHTFAPIDTLSPILGAFLERTLFPITVLHLIHTLFPIIAFSLITIPLG